MDSFELNKIAGAVLGSLTVVLGLSALSDAIFSQAAPEKPGYEIAELQEAGAAGGAPGGGEAAITVASLLPKADVAKGEAASKKCGACHSFDKGGPSKAGPNLYGVVGLKHGHVEGFGYSAALKATAEQTWDFAAMDKWLENPKGYIAGTSMAFAGIKNVEERANLIAYLNKNSDAPLEIPAAPAPAAGEAVAGGAAPAGGAPAGGGVKALVAAADLKKGEAQSKKCGACHSFDKGGPSKAGPNLYGVVGLKHAHVEGFGYSDAMKKTADKVWDVDNLDKWLENPKGYIQGTSMAFAGIKNADDRAALIAWLNKNSDKPVDLGGAAAAPASDPSDKADVGGAKAPGDQKGAEGADKGDGVPGPGAKPGLAQDSIEKGAAAPAKPADQAAAPAAPAEAPAAPAAAAEPIEKRLASADIAKGEAAVGAQCAVCHTVNKGGEAGAGPNIYGIVGLKHGHQEGFEYSDVLKAKQGPWTFAELDKWLENPEAYASGTMMAFPGIEDAQERADIIAYLNKNSDTPQPIEGAAPKP